MKIAPKLFVVSMLATALAMSFSTAAAAQSDRSGVAPTVQFRQCVEEQGYGLVLFLVDESQSLRITDSANDRVIALVARINEIVDYQRQREQPIEIMLSGFGTDFRPHTEWLDVSDESSVQTAIAETVAFLNKTDEIDTDYFLAFEGAAASLRDKSINVLEETQTRPCTALYWVTDGEYDIEPRISEGQREFGTTKSYGNLTPIDITSEEGARTAERVGEELLCATDGPVAQLNDGETSSLAIILTSGSNQVDTSVADKVMRGSPGGRGCEPALGAVETTDDLGETQPVIGEPVEGNRGRSGPDQEYTFNVSPLMSSVNAVVSGEGSSVAESSPRLRAPDGSELILETPPVFDYRNQIATLDGQAISWRWTERSVHIAIDFQSALETSSEEWAIVWRSDDPTITARITATTIYQIEIVTPDGRPLVAGGENEIEIKVVGEDGELLPPGTLDDIEATATIDFGDGPLPLPLEPSESGYTARPRVPEGATEASVQVELEGIDQGDGLNESVKIEELPVARPGFPAIQFEVPDFTGEGVLNGTVTAIGDDVHGACVWLDQISFDPVTEQRIRDGSLVAPAVGNQENCQPVPAGQTTTFDVPVLEVTDQEFRRVEISPTFGVLSDATDQVQLVETGLEEPQLAPEVTTQGRTAVLVTILTMTVGLALLFNRLFAQLFQDYQISNSLRRIEVPVTITRDGVELENGQALSSVLVTDYPRVGGKPPTADSFRFDRRLSWLPWVEPHGTATSSKLDYLIGSSGAGQNYSTGHIALGLRGGWILGLKDPNTPTGPGAPPHQVDGQLVTFVEDPAELERVDDELVASLGVKFAELPWGTTIDLRNEPGGSAANQDPTREMDPVWATAGLPGRATGGDVGQRPAPDSTIELAGDDRRQETQVDRTMPLDDDLLLPED